MNELATGDDDRRLLMQFAAHYEAPAYVRRARQTEQAYEELVERCRRQRFDWLAGVRWRLTALLTRWSEIELAAVIGPRSAEKIAHIQREAEAKTQSAFTGRLSPRLAKSLLRELRASITRFNRRWAVFLDELDLTEINRLRDGYNRYYLLEKECAVGSAKLAAASFRRLPALTVGDIRLLFPPLPIP